MLGANGPHAPNSPATTATTSLESRSLPHKGTQAMAAMFGRLKKERSRRQLAPQRPATRQATLSSTWDFPPHFPVQ